MSLVGLITGKEISLLDHTSFRKVANTLLIVEAAEQHVPASNLDLTTRENDPDGGIDARLRWPSDLRHDIFSGGENAIQYKSGKLTVSQLRQEFIKPGVQSTLRKGGNYRLLVGHDYVAPDADKLEHELGKLCEKHKVPRDKCKILFGGQIANWILRFPSIIILPELGKGYPAFVTVEQWSHQTELRNPWRPDDPRVEIAAIIAAFVNGSGDDPVLRIEGPTGVGKTRLTLEALRLSGIAERCVYCPDAENPNAQQFLAQLAGQPLARGVVVVDECDSDQQQLLSHYVRAAQGSIRLICVGPADVLYESPPGLSQVYTVRQLADEKVAVILKDVVSGAPSEIIDTGVRLSEGYVKLAIFVADILNKRRDIALTELRKIYNIRVFLKKFVDDQTRMTLQALSLLARIGWEEKLWQEAETVARHLGIAIPDLQHAVKVLRDQGVVLPRGRYLYVSPELLAISAAADLWDERSASLIKIMEEFPSPGPRRELLRRLAVMGRHPEVKKAVERLFDEKEGLFKTLSDLDQEFLSEVFRFLSSALPESAQKVLERLIENVPREKLLDFKNGRRNVIWALESLLRRPETSLSAARSLRSLAAAENESIGNSATGIFRQFFQLRLSGSPIPLVDRFPLLDPLIGGDEIERGLVVKAADAALQRHESRMGGDTDYISGRKYPPEWRPTKWGEVWQARRTATDYLKKIVAGHDSAAMQARNELLSSVYTLYYDGLRDETLQVLESFVDANDTERRSILEICSRLKEQPGEGVTEAQRSRLNDIEASMFGHTFFDQLKRWVGRRLHTDYDLTAGRGYEDADQKVRELADLAFTSGLRDEEIAWLVSGEAENVWAFGLRLGEIDSDHKFLERIVTASPDDVNPVLLASYLVGQSSKDNDFREDFLDQIADSRPLLAFACTWRGPSSERGLARISQLVRSKRVPPLHLRFLTYGGWTNSLTEDQITELLNLMLEVGGNEVVEATMSLTHQVLMRKQATLERLEPLVWRLLEARPTEPSRHSDWEWGQLAEFVAKRNPRRMVEIVLSFFELDWFVPLQDDSRMIALSSATKADPLAAWELVGTELLRGDKASTGLYVALRQWYGELIPMDLLLEWAAANEPKGPWIVSSLVLAKGNRLPSRARELLIRFPQNEGVGNQLWANLRSGSWMGSHADHVESELNMARNWVLDPAPEVRSWASEIVNSLEIELKRERILEEEETF